MKLKSKIIAFVAAAMMMTTTIYAAVTITGQKADDVSVVIDGKVQTFVDANGNPISPIVVDGVTYLPLRSVSTAFDKTVDWNELTKTITITSNGANTTPTAPETTKPSAGSAVNLIEVTNKGDSSTGSKLKGEASLGEIAGGKYQTAIKMPNVNGAYKKYTLILNDSFSTLSTTVLFISDETEKCQVKLIDAETDLVILDKDVEANKEVELKDVDITGIKKLTFYVMGKTGDNKALVYFLNPTVK